MRILAARVAHFPGGRVGFLDARNDLPPDRAVLVRRIDQVEEIRRDGQGQLVVGEARARPLLRREGRHQPLQLLQRGDPVLELPVPVVPVGIRNISSKNLCRPGVNCFKRLGRVAMAAPRRAPEGVSLCIFDLKQLAHYRFDRKRVKLAGQAGASGAISAVC